LKHAGCCDLGVIVPFLVVVVLGVEGKVDFHGGDAWMLLVMACELSFWAGE
jgi:hypothetical protein